jgi:outer membrane protein assembly factor BamE (lipoprotein component of BamABCDE complex)
MKPLLSRIPVVSVVVLIGLLAALPGCLVTGSSESKRSGNYVAESTFSQIKPGVTTVGWVQATLGEPTSKSTADGDEIWKYAYTERTDNSGAVFLIFGGSNSQETTGTAYVEFRNGVVVNKWRG